MRKSLLLMAACALAACASPAPAVTPAPARATPVTASPAPAPSATPAPRPTITSAPTRAATPQPVEFDGDRAYDWVVRQVALGPRIVGGAAHRALGDQILAELGARGWQTRTQSFTYRNTPIRNLIAFKGTGAEAVLLGAHYDTRTRADQDAVRPDLPVPGANDGASGTAVLLELARTLDVPATGKQVWLVFFDAEDNGNLDGWDWIVGSRYFAQNMTSTMPVSPAAVVVVDMVGDAQQDIYLERNSNRDVSDQIWAVARRLGYQDQFRAVPKWSMLDDHTPFLERGLRAVDIIDFDYPHWHRTSDTPDKVSADSLGRVGRTLQAWLEGR